MDLSSPKVMGIINLTPDSFYSNSRVEEKEILETAERMIGEGAHILDIGAYSSRPGADDIEVEEEEGRLIPSLEALKKEFKEVPISVDTFRSSVAKKALDLGADMINDISGGVLDPAILNQVLKHKVPYVIMHMKGTPQTMVRENQYEDMMIEIIDHLKQRVFKISKLGIADLIIDPGFGFAKDIDQNFHLLKNLSELRIIERPILAGLSRKSMIYKKLNVSTEDALNGTTVVNTLALNQGVNILRVHDVKEAVESIKIFELYNNATSI